MLEIAHLGKGSHADCCRIARQNTSRLFDMLGLVAVHYGSLAVFEVPRTLPYIQSDRVPAELVDGDLHRRAGPERWIKKDQSDTLAKQRPLVVLARLEFRREIDQVGELRLSEIGGAQKISSLDVHQLACQKPKAQRLRSGNEDVRQFAICTFQFAFCNSPQTSKESAPYCAKT